MRINEQNKSMDMEARDINYILPAYLRSYQFHSKNELPTKIIFPMFPSVKAANGVDIPIEYVPPLEPVAAEIAEDGGNVPEVTPEQEAAIDEKEAETEALKAKMAELTEPAEEGLTEEEQTEPPPESPAKAAFQPEPKPTEEEITSGLAPPPPPDRKPKQPPGGDIGPGQGPSDMHSRDRQDQIRTARDLVEEPEIEGTPEKPFEKEISRDDQGNPVVEDMTEQ